MIKLKLKKGDNVKVISGSDKGKEGKILKVIPSENKAVVENIFVCTKRIKPKANSPKGGIEKIEMPINISNLMYLLKDGSITRIGFKDKDGKVVRYSKKTGEIIE